jgi:hypothetical protein
VLDPVRARRERLHHLQVAQARQRIHYVVIPGRDDEGGVLEPVGQHPELDAGQVAGAGGGERLFGDRCPDHRR